MRRRRQRGTRRTPEDERTAVAFEQEREVRASALTDAARAQIARAEAVLVEKRTDAVEDEQRDFVRPSAAASVSTMSPDGIVRSYAHLMRRRLYLMRHAEVSYFLEDGRPATRATCR